VILSDEQFIAELKTRLGNPAVSDPELAVYLTAAKCDVDSGLYDNNSYNAQILDTACHLLSLDNKFPEISSVSQNGVTTSFAGNDSERWTKRITERRQAIILGTAL
jgi:hypothetical protein